MEKVNNSVKELKDISSNNIEEIKKKIESLKNIVGEISTETIERLEQRRLNKQPHLKIRKVQINQPIVNQPTDSANQPTDSANQPTDSANQSNTQA